jgi:predicted Fe-Mo cluster-binding NifX family protein
MQKIVAITLWNDIVSPLYDAACRLLIERCDGQQQLVSVRNRSLVQRAQLCRAQGVELVVCGAISTPARELLNQHGVEVCGWVCGSVTALLEALRKGQSLHTHFAMPHYAPHCCRRRGRSGRC